MSEMGMYFGGDEPDDLESMSSLMHFTAQCDYCDYSTSESWLPGNYFGERADARARRDEHVRLRHPESVEPDRDASGRPA